MIIGLDFDNTIVDYDLLFYKIALEKKLIPADTPKNKVAVRDFLRKVGKEDEWTRMQGEAYTTRILEAVPYPGVESFLKECSKKGIEIRIISHKTQHPFIGEKEDLHEWARKWIEKHGYLKYVTQVHFELTNEDKLKRISGCDFFVDDLPEFLNLPGFPHNTEKVLFDPAGVHDFHNKARTWEDVEAIILVKRHTQSILTKAGFEGDFTLHRIKAGKNNRAYEVKLKNKKLLLKSYFSSENDKRDRLGAEYEYLKHLENLGVDCVPKAYAADEKEKIGLYEFIDGKKPVEAKEELVQQALDFILKSKKPHGTRLASDACLSVKQHLELAEKRIARLEHVPELKEFIAELKRDLDKHSHEILKKPDHILDFNEQILSPSDFGMHNALLSNSKLYFIDFEYAGLDDPAKMVCDFFCQPDIPIPMQYFDTFAGKVFEGDPQGLERTKMLLPVHRIKWCCIMLNEFVAVDAERRKFSGASHEDVRAQQLKKAQDYYHRHS